MTHQAVDFIHETDCFAHTDAERIYRSALHRNTSRTVVIDLGNAKVATTSAFARLVLLRRALRQAGRDLLVIGLRGRAALLFEVNRLRDVIPAEMFSDAPALAI